MAISELFSLVIYMIMLIALVSAIACYSIVKNKMGKKQQQPDVMTIFDKFDETPRKLKTVIYFKSEK